ncbi:MAG: hypothetical protein GWP10_18660 [Nitrospiraceae bacterium]|nr:hypothetical protein [Nitrospiraceae bacterium]
MSLLSEYALTPDIFDSTSYSSDEIGRTHLQHLKEVLLNEGLVRDLRNGAWHSLFIDNIRPWHLRGKELLKKLITQHRLRLFPEVRDNEPTTDREWCQESLASHKIDPITGIITTSKVAANFRDKREVASIDRLSSAHWWAIQSPSVRLARTTEAYKENLKLVLRCANSIMFIDPHLDPTRKNYGEFISLLEAMYDREPAPLIEIHRVCYYGSGSRRKLFTPSEWKKRFHDEWDSRLQNVHLSVKIFIWDDFHDRYLISDLVGINVPNGFDTTKRNSKTTWTRLGRNDRDDVQREFEDNGRHTLRCNFTVP